MREKKGGFFEKQSLLLLSIVFFSLLFFFFLLCCISPAPSDEGAMLLGTAMLLGLCMPAFFFLRSTVGEGLSFLGNTPGLRTLPSLLLFSLGSLSAGAFLAECLMADGSALLFSRLAFPSEVTPFSIAAVIVYAFTVAFVPFGLIYSYLAPKGTLLSLLVSCFFFTALSFSLEGLPYFLLLGLLLGLIRWQSGTFLAPLLGTMFLSFGGYAVVTGLFDYQRLMGLSQDSFLLWSGILSVMLFILSQGIWRHMKESLVPSDKKTLLIWAPFALLAVGVSVVLTLIF